MIKYSRSTERTMWSDCLDIYLKNQLSISLNSLVGFVLTTCPNRPISASVAESTNPSKRKKKTPHCPDDDFVPNPNSRLRKYFEKPKSYNYIFLQSMRQKYPYLKIPHSTRTQSSNCCGLFPTICFLFTTLPFGPMSVFKIAYKPVLYICTGHPVHLQKYVKTINTAALPSHHHHQSHWHQHET